MSSMSHWGIHLVCAHGMHVERSPEVVVMSSEQASPAWGLCANVQMCLVV